MANAVPVAEDRIPNMNSQDEDRRLRWNETSIPSPETGVFDIAKSKTKLSKWRHTLGIILLLLTVFLWTTSNFLASVGRKSCLDFFGYEVLKSSQTIFADNTYSKPYFVTYVNTSFFVIPLIPILLRLSRKDPSQFSNLANRLRGARYSRIEGHDVEGAALLRVENEEETSHRPLSGRLALEDENSNSHVAADVHPPLASDPLDLVETAKLGLEFCIIWYLANYFVAACLEYTTVASGTILTSTSSIWTLLLGALMRVERFSIKKLLGVLASLAGVIMISTVDLSGKNDETRGSFPHKSRQQIAIGDALAFISAVLYGLYSVFLKKRVGDETRVNLPLFFGFVGLINILLLWPGIVILHYTGVEEFELPPDRRILAIVLVGHTWSIIVLVCHS